MAAWILFGMLLILDAIGSFPLFGGLALMAISLGLLSKKNRAKKIKLFFAYLFEVLILFGFWQVQVSVNKREGEKIAFALEQYMQKNGEYPLLLIELKPEFIKEIPSVRSGLFSKRKFVYVRNEKDMKKYSLFFYRMPFPISIHYSPEKKDWNIVG